MSPFTHIPDAECEWSFARSGGAGGQNVNKVSTKAVLRWRPATSRALSDEEKSRLFRVLASRLNEEGELLVTAQDTRSQELNRDEALRKLNEIVASALVVPKRRKKTKPTHGSKVRRVEAKRRRSEHKRNRDSRGWE